MSLLWVEPTNSWFELALHVPSWPKSLAWEWTTRYGTQCIPIKETLCSEVGRSRLYCLSSSVSCSISSLKHSWRSQETSFLSWHYLFNRKLPNVFGCLSKLLRFQSWELQSTQSSFYPSLLEDEVPCLFKNVIFSRVFVWFSTCSTLRRMTRSSTKLKCASS